MDLLAAGKMMAWDTGLSAGVQYRVKMKLMDESISSQNRIILCKAEERNKNGSSNSKRDMKREVAHAKLTRAYNKAHQLPQIDNPKLALKGPSNPIACWCIRSLLTGVCIGAVSSIWIASLRKR